MRALLLAMMLLPGWPKTVLSLKLDGEQWGEFQSMRTSLEAPNMLVLQTGHLRGGFLEFWWENAAAAPGRYERNPAECRGRNVTVVQTLGQGLRKRERTWTLLDGCPVAWEISGVENDGGILIVDWLSLAGRGIAVSR